MNADIGKDMNASKLRTNCGELAKKSYACLEKSSGGITIIILIIIIIFYVIIL